MLTDKQKEKLDYIIEHIEKNGHSPTQAEIASRFRIVQSCARDYIKVLHNKKYIDVMDCHSRQIKVLKDSSGNKVELKFIFRAGRDRKWG
jgi:SOS-response transcriptional repressor LexA